MSNTNNITFDNFFTDLENTRPFVKVGLEGFAGGGKTRTAAEIAIGLHKAIKSTKPIICFDTEKGLKALKPLFDKDGIAVRLKESRTLADLGTTMSLCEQGAADILIIDSLTHVWESFIEGYKKTKKRDNLYFQDWGIVKPKWKREFSDVFVQSNLHIIFTGRAGYEYEETENPETHKKELHKSGIKMKAENETAYEPDVLILMERCEEVVGKKKKIWREGTIIKDRTATIDGKTFKNPSYADFKPSIDILLDGVIKKAQKQNPDKFESAEMDAYNKKAAREIACEEIWGIFDSLGIGTGKEEKQLKLAVLENVFETTSKTAIEGLPLDKLEAGCLILKDFKLKFIEFIRGLDNLPDVENVLDLLKKSKSEINLFD